MASCEGASSQVRAAKMGERAEEKPDELVILARSSVTRQAEPRRPETVGCLLMDGESVMPSAPTGIDEYQGGQRPRGTMSPGQMTDRRRIGRPQEGHRGK